jgi:hypothetical protein
MKVGDFVKAILDQSTALDVDCAFNIERWNVGSGTVSAFFGARRKIVRAYHFQPDGEMLADTRDPVDEVRGAADKLRNAALERQAELQELEKDIPF